MHEKKRRNVDSITSLPLAVLSSCFFSVSQPLFFPSSCILISFLQLLDTVLSSSQMSGVHAFVLTPSRGIVACLCLSKTLHTRCSRSHELKFVQASSKDVQQPRPALHAFVCLPSSKAVSFLLAKTNMLKWEIISVAICNVKILQQ